MDSLCWRGLQHLDPDLVFHSDESDDGIGSRHWSLRYQWNASALSCTVFDTMIAICPPGHHHHAFVTLLNEQFEDMECCFSPSPFHTIFPTPQKAQLQSSLMRDYKRYYQPTSQPLFQNCHHNSIHSTIFHGNFGWIRRTTSQTVQSNCTKLCEPVVKELFKFLWPGRSLHSFVTTCAHFCKWPNFPSSSSAGFSHHKRKSHT